MTEIKKVDKFLGLSNKLDPLKHKPGALKSAINVDIDDINNIRRRNGYVLHASYANITDSYSTKDKQNAYIIDSGELINVRTGISIGTGFGNSVLWDDHNGSVFIHGDKIGLIENDKFTNLDHPQCPQPKVKRVTGYQTAGYYQVACAYRDSNGREGGMASPIVILVDDGSALEVTVEQIPDYEVTIYVSPVNGKYVYKWQTTDAITSVFNGPQHLLASPANDIQFGALPIQVQANSMVYHQSKLYVCEYIPEEDKSVIWFSKSFSYHLFNKSHDYIVINNKVTNLINIGQALVITSEKSIFYYVDGQLKQVALYGAPAGKPYCVSQQGEHFLWSNNGICKLNEFSNLTEKVHKLPTSPSVFSAIIEQNGYGRFVNLLGDKTNAENIFRS